jgi:hypothetical protein
MVVFFNIHKQKPFLPTFFSSYFSTLSWISLYFPRVPTQSVYTRAKYLVQHLQIYRLVENFANMITSIMRRGRAMAISKRLAQHARNVLVKVADEYECTDEPPCNSRRCTFEGLACFFV